MDPTHPLEQLRHKLAAPAEGYFDSTLYARLSVVEFGGLLHVDFFGSPFNEPYLELCRTLCNAAVAERLASIVLRGPDEGANGTCNWDLSSLVESDTMYPTFKLLSIQQNGPADHNRMIVATDFDEAGVLGVLLQRAPVLDALITPSAPDASFFAVRDHPLRYLNVDAGYDTQNFIGNLANSLASQSYSISNSASITRHISTPFHKATRHFRITSDYSAQAHRPTCARLPCAIQYAQ
jgi:hypothetical protein